MANLRSGSTVGNMPIAICDGNVQDFLNADMLFGARLSDSSSAASDILWSSDKIEKTYVKLSGSTMTGGLTLNNGANQGEVSMGSSGWVSVSPKGVSIGAWDRGYYFGDTSGTLKGGLGIYGSGTTVSYIYLGYGANPYSTYGFKMDVGNGKVDFASTPTVANTPVALIYSAQQASLTFDTSSTAPTLTNRLNLNGYFYATKVYNAVYNDYAEYFEKIEPLEPGDVIVTNIAGNGYLKSRRSYDNGVVGVYSDDYAHCIGGKGDGHDEENYAPIGMAGRVRVKVIGIVRKNDLLVSSNIPGVAMAIDSRGYIPGTVIGKALQSHEGDSIDRIQMLISII